MQTVARGLGILLLVLGLPALAPEGVRAKDALPRIKRSPEFKYVDATDDEEAAKHLEKLLKKYDTPKKCAGLLKILRTKRSFPGRMPGRMTLEHACLDGRTREFTYILPSKYSKRKPTGVLVFLHGAISQPAPGGGANEAGMFAPSLKPLNLIVIGPSTYDRVEWGTPQCRALIRHAISFAKQYFNVDENRVYVAGDSDGGRGTYATLETESNFVAAAVPVIGAPGGVTRFLNLRNVPIFAINGETDGLFKIDRVRQSVEGMKASGIDIRFEVAEGAGHDPYLFQKRKDKICDFLKAHPREPYPKTVYLQVDTSRPAEEQGFPANTMRWIRIDETGSTSSRGTFEDGAGSLVPSNLPRAEATYEGNRIDVKTSNVKRYTILVSDEMLDLAKPITVTTNGKASFEGVVEPDAKAILEEARRFQDRTTVFANRVTIDLE